MFRYYFIAIILLILDQVTKMLAVNSMQLGDSINFIPGLQFTLAYNHGAAFGILANSNGWQKWFFIAIAALVITIITVWIKISSQKKLVIESLALALILSGAIGNLIDRLLYGYVVDFIDFYIKSWHWYTFNIADIAICVGAGLMVYDVIFQKNKS